MDFIEDDLTDILDTAELSVNVTYTEQIYPHPSSNSVEIAGIPGYAYIESSKVAGYFTTLKTKASHFINLQEGDYLAMESVEYTIVDWEYAVFNKMITLILQKV